MKDSVAIIGVGSSMIERSSDRSIVAFALDAVIDALADAGVDRESIDGYVGAPSATNPGALHVDGADELSLRLMAERLGLRRLRWSADLYWDFLSNAVVAAVHALRCEACNYVLLVRAMSRLPDVSYQSVRHEHALGEEQFAAPFGYRTAGVRFAMRAREYLERSGATRANLFEVVALARTNAARNPLAIWRDRPVTLDEYLAAPMIASPLCRLDCDMPVNGAVAFVLTRAELAVRTRRPPVFVAGWSQWQRPESIFETSHRTRQDVQVCQLYDGFSSMVYEWLERLGWCEPHAAWRFISEGRASLDGSLPINTFGGSLGEGRLHGAGHLREAVLQLSARAVGRQVPNARNCLVQIGPHDYASLLMLSAIAD